MYFQKFPLYATYTRDGYSIIIQDIFKRIAVENRFSDVSVFLTPYFVLDGETPELIANKVYNNPQYHWIVLYINNIINPRTEWPLENRYVVPLIYDEYDFKLVPTEVGIYAVGDVLTTSEEGRLVIKEVNVDENYILARSTVGQTFITNTTQITRNRVGVDKLKNLRMVSILDPEETVHHYVNVVTGYQVDYDADNPDIIPVTNYEYEFGVNDDKRNIRLLDPKYLREFVKNFDDLING